MQITDQTHGNTLVLEVAGRLDSASSGAFEQNLIGRIGDGANDVVVDLARLDYISSAGLRVLLMAAKRLKPANGRIALCNLDSHNREVFEISGFLSIFEVFASRDEAVASAAA